MAEEYYHDRKMMKWMPFNALLEQGEHLKELLDAKNKEEKPLLSDDQLAELNYDLEYAYISQKEVKIQYFKQYKRLEMTGYIHKIDVQNKMIIVGDQGIYAEDVLQIKMI
jgi:hypothetical protein